MADKEKNTSNKIAEERKLEENMKILRNLRMQHIVDINMVRVVLAVWFAAAILVILPNFRETYSEVEKRELKKFPKITWSAVVSGDYFDEISLWFSDTFPLRDNFVKLNTKFTNAYGINAIKVHGEVEEGDEIPDAVPVPDEQINTEIEMPEEVLPQPHQPIIEDLGTVITIDDTGYEYYHFNQTAADTYCSAINRAASILEGKAKVYSMIVPTSIDITMPSNYRETIKTSDQKKAIDYMYSRMSSSVSKIDTYSSLVAHKNEYIYFRTDHHWTALGAYYAYCDFMNVKGAIPAKLSDFTERKYEGFLGSFYSDTKQSPALGANPDTIVAYEPKQLQTIHSYTQEGEKDLRIVYDADKLTPRDKYMTFICGDKPYGVMTNPEITDGSSCLVLKESFGNAMVGYLTQNYQNVYVVDYRYVSQVYSGTLRQFVEERGINDVIFVNNISATRNASLVNAVNVFVGQ